MNSRGNSRVTHASPTAGSHREPAAGELSRSYGHFRSAHAFDVVCKGRELTESQDQRREGEQRALRARARMHFAAGEQDLGCGDAQAAAPSDPVREDQHIPCRVPCRVLQLCRTPWRATCHWLLLVFERCLGWEGLRRRTRAATAARHRQGARAGEHPTHPTHPTRSIGKGSLSLLLVSACWVCRVCRVGGSGLHCGSTPLSATRLSDEATSACGLRGARAGGAPAMISQPEYDFTTMKS